MRIVWDEAKRQETLRRRRLDFADLEDGFAWGDMLVTSTYPGTEGRARYIAVAPMNATLITIIFSPLGNEAIAIISMRSASRRERKQYAER